MKKRIIWLVFLLLLFISSYYREVLFRSINAIIDGSDFFYAKTTDLPFLYSWTKAELVQLKYFLTLSFSVLFMMLSLIGLRLSFIDKTPYQMSLFIYGGVVFLSLIIAVIGLVFLSFNEVYPSLRKIIGYLHSPILYLFISIGYIGFINLKEKT